MARNGAWLGCGSRDFDGSTPHGPAGAPSCTRLIRARQGQLSPRFAYRTSASPYTTSRHPPDTLDFAFAAARPAVVDFPGFERADPRLRMVLSEMRPAIGYGSRTPRGATRRRFNCAGPVASTY